MANENRILSFDDLPASVQAIPEDYNPLLDDGLFMAHQKAWLKDKSKLKLCEKGRRTGITWAEAFDSTLAASVKKSDGGMNVFYIGDTKEKGLEFIGYCAHFAKSMAVGADIEEFFFEDMGDDGNTRMISGYRMKLSSGFRIEALSSRPENIRGKQGRVVIDEAAFHKKIADVLAAVNALLIWGGVVRVISTHNGALNPFNELIQDIHAGAYPYSLHHVTFDDAVANGLYERVCQMGKKKPTKAGKAKWYNDVRGSYGSDTESMKEELDAIPKSGNGSYLPFAMINGLMQDGIPVVRYEQTNDFNLLSDSVREADVNIWLDETIKPLLDKLDKNQDHFFGEDFARSGDVTALWPLARQQNLSLKTPFIVELRNMPFQQQEQIVNYILKGLPRFRCGAFDTRGNGQYLGERAMQTFGASRIAQVMLSPKWYRENMPRFKAHFEDQDLSIPKDADVLADMRCVQMDNGYAKVPDGMKVKGSDGQYRHGDTAIALALACFAAVQNYAPIEYDAAPVKGSRFDPDDNDDNDTIDFEGEGAW